MRKNWTTIGIVSRGTDKHHFVIGKARVLCDWVKFYVPERDLMSSSQKLL